MDCICSWQPDVFPIPIGSIWMQPGYDGVFAHPTLAESLNNLFSAFDEYKR